MTKEHTYTDLSLTEARVKGGTPENDISVPVEEGKIIILQTDYEISITGADGTITDQKISKGLDVTAKPGQVVTKDSLLTTDPNVGGFGQEETEIVLQNPNRVKGMIIFFFIATGLLVFNFLQHTARETKIE